MKKNTEEKMVQKRRVVITGLGAVTMIEEDKVLEDPKMDMAFAAHGWPSVESGKIGIVRRYAFGCVGDFKVRIIGKKGHASWPEQTIDPIAAANEIYQHIPAILTRTISGTEPKIMSVTYMQAGDVNVRNIIPQDCVFGGTMRAVKREVLEKMKAELEKAGLTVWDSCANYLFFEGPKGLAARLEKGGILIRDCSNYPGLADGYYRAAVRTHEENQILTEAVSQILQWF